MKNDYEENSPVEVEASLLNRLVNESRRTYWEHPVYKEDGLEYMVPDAIDVTIQRVSDEAKLSPANIAAKVVQDFHLPPNETILQTLLEGSDGYYESWEDLFVDITRAMIQKTLYGSNDTDIYWEDQRRMDLADKRVGL